MRGKGGLRQSVESVGGGRKQRGTVESRQNVIEKGLDDLKSELKESIKTLSTLWNIYYDYSDLFDKAEQQLIEKIDTYNISHDADKILILYVYHEYNDRVKYFIENGIIKDKKYTYKHKK